MSTYADGSQQTYEEIWAAMEPACSRLMVPVKAGCGAVRPAAAEEAAPVVRQRAAEAAAPVLRQPATGIPARAA